MEVFFVLVCLHHALRHGPHEKHWLSGGSAGSKPVGTHEQPLPKLELPDHACILWMGALQTTYLSWVSRATTLPSHRSSNGLRPLRAPKHLLWVGKGLVVVCNSQKWNAIGAARRKESVVPHGENWQKEQSFATRACLKFLLDEAVEGWTFEGPQTQAYCAYWIIQHCTEEIMLS